MGVVVGVLGVVVGVAVVLWPSAESPPPLEGVPAGLEESVSGGLESGGSPEESLAVFVALDAGWEHTCALRTDGTVACWGNSYNGQAGVLPGPVDYRDKPLGPVFPAPTGLLAAVSAGGEHTCGVRTDGTVACWGSSYWRQAETPGGRFSAIAAGGWHTCALRVDATADCWGLNDTGTPRDDLLIGEFGAVRIPSLNDAGTPRDDDGMCWQPTTAVPIVCWSGAGEDPDGLFDAISAGAVHTCGLRTDATIACWGHGPGAQIDFPNDARSARFPSENVLCWARARSSNLPCAVYGDVGQGDAPAGTYSAVTAGGWHTCGLRTDATIACWGHNNHGQAEAPAGVYVAVSAGWAHTCALRADGTATCWGDNSHQQSNAPTGAFVAIAAGGTHTCGLRTDNTITCWGTPGFVPAPDGVQWN